MLQENNLQNNKKIYWIDFLHVYQPPTQSLEIVKKISEESYDFIINFLKKYPQFKITLNISGSLIELLEKINRKDIINSIKELVELKQIELTASAMYHPILPLIPESEIERQINLNEEILTKHFGEVYKKNGFYLPEMAYSRKVGEIIKNNGFKWIILDEIHFNRKNNPDNKYVLENGLIVIFRNRFFSKDLSPKIILDKKSEINSNYIITGHDGEMYGHWFKDVEESYKKIIESNSIESLTVSEYLSKINKIEKIKINETHWEADEKHLKNKIFFHLWNNKKNKIHKKIWIFINKIIEIINQNKSDSNFIFARKHLDKGLNSCTWWWSSGEKIDIHSPKSWNPDFIEIGLKEMIKSVRSLKNIKDSQKIKLEKLYSKIIFLIWKEHWSKHNK